MGRPAIKFSPEKLESVHDLVLLGATNRDIAKYLKVSGKSFDDLISKNKEFSRSLKLWRKETDEKVEKRLYERALGYELDEISYEKIKIGKMDLKLSEEEKKEIKRNPVYKVKITTKKVLPDVTAQIFWLKNRDPARWREKVAEFRDGGDTHYHFTNVQLNSMDDSKLFETLMRRDNGQRELNRQILPPEKLPQ